MEKHGGRVMAPVDAYGAPQNRRDLSPAGSVVWERGTVHSCNGRFKTDMHTGGIQDTGTGHLAREPSCAGEISVGMELSRLILIAVI